MDKYGISMDKYDYISENERKLLLVFEDWVKFLFMGLNILLVV